MTSQIIVDVITTTAGASFITASTNPNTGGMSMQAGLLRAEIVKSSRPKDNANPSIVPRSAFTSSTQTLWRASSTEVNIFSETTAKWMRCFKTGVYTSSASAGVASQFWRLVKLIELSGFVAVPTVTPSSAGSFTTAARDIHPNTTDGGQTVASGIVYGSSTQNDVVSWAVTVPASGIVKCLLLNSSGAAQAYTVACGGQSKSGTLTQSTTAGLLPQIITLYGCTTGAQTLSVTKTGPSGVLYTAGQCVDAATASPAAASSVIYWFETTSRYIDGNGANELALNIGGTFYGSYHGGHYGATTWRLSGAVVDVLSGGPVFSATTVSIEQEGRIGSIAAASNTQIYPDGHSFDLSLRADALAMTEAHLVMTGCRPDMSIVNTQAVPEDSTYHAIGAGPFVDMQNSTRSKALTAWIESLQINGASPVGLYAQSINTGSSGYCKGYLSIPITSLSSLYLKTTWAY